MTKKAKLYLLVLINLISWSYVGVKIYNALTGNEELEFNAQQTFVSSLAESNSVPEYQMSLNYNDPFLKNHRASNVNRDVSGNSNSSLGINSHHQNKDIQNSKVVTTNTVSDNEPEFKYLGILKNNVTGIQTVMLSVNGKTILAKKNDLIEGYKLIKISDNSVKFIKGKFYFEITK